MHRRGKSSFKRIGSSLDSEYLSVGYNPEKSRAMGFRALGRYVENAEKAGKKILAVLAYDTAWIYGRTRQKPGGGTLNGENILFPSVCRECGSKVSRKNRAYEIWNEPNWTFWKGPDEDFFQLCTAAARRIKEISPESYVVIGSFLRVPESFIRGLFQAGAFTYAMGYPFIPMRLIRMEL
jgi:hypothetical protein